MSTSLQTPPPRFGAVDVLGLPMLPRSDVSPSSDQCSMKRCVHILSPMFHGALCPCPQPYVTWSDVFTSSALCSMKRCVHVLSPTFHGAMCPRPQPVFHEAMCPHPQPYVPRSNVSTSSALCPMERCVHILSPTFHGAMCPHPQPYVPWSAVSTSSALRSMERCVHVLSPMFHGAMCPRPQPYVPWSDVFMDRCAQGRIISFGLGRRHTGPNGHIGAWLHRIVGTSLRGFITWTEVRHPIQQQLICPPISRWTSILKPLSHNLKARCPALCIVRKRRKKTWSAHTKISPAKPCWYLCRNCRLIHSGSVCHRGLVLFFCYYY